MALVMTVPCRSYSDQEFDNCQACLDAALDAVAQAAIYVVGHAAPSLTSQNPVFNPIEMAYRLKVRLFDDADRQLAEDEFDTDQTVAAVAADDEWTTEAADTAANEDALDGRPLGSMRLDDFQTLLDRIELAPAGMLGAAGTTGASGGIDGRLFGFERPICRFEVEVCPSR